MLNINFVSKLCSKQTFRAVISVLIIFPLFQPQNRSGGFGGGGGGGMTGRTTKIFIGGLPNNIGEDTIRESFSRFGNVSYS